MLWYLKLGFVCINGQKFIIKLNFSIKYSSIQNNKYQTNIQKKVLQMKCNKKLKYIVNKYWID